MSQISGVPGTQGAFLDKVSSDIDGFTDELVVQCDARVGENNLLDDSK